MADPQTLTVEGHRGGVAAVDLAPLPHPRALEAVAVGRQAAGDDARRVERLVQARHQVGAVDVDAVGDDEEQPRRRIGQLPRQPPPGLPRRSGARLDGEGAQLDRVEPDDGHGEAVVVHAHADDLAPGRAAELARPRKRPPELLQCRRSIGQLRGAERQYQRALGVELDRQRPRPAVGGREGECHGLHFLSNDSGDPAPDTATSVGPTGEPLNWGG